MRMKKLFFAMLAAAAFMVSCDKTSTDDVYTLEGQWLTEEEPAYGEYPASRMLMDVGAKSGAGKMTMAMLMTDSNAAYNEGDLLLLSKGSYTYDSTTGKLSMGGESATVKFLAADKLTLSADGIDLYFTRATKEYSLLGMKDPAEIEDRFVLSTLNGKEADWAGGSLMLVSTREIKNLRYEVVTEGVHEANLCKTSIDDKILTLGLYLDENNNIADCDIKVIATDPAGNEAELIITSDAWMPILYENVDGEFIPKSDGKWARGACCWLGVSSTTDEITYVGENNSFGGIVYTIPDFMEAYGDSGKKVCCDLPMRNESGVITFTYGDLTFEYPISIEY